MMVDGRQRAEWARATPALYLLYDIRRLQCDPKRAPKALEMRDFDPFATKEIPVSIKSLRDVFVKKK